MSNKIIIHNIIIRLVFVAFTLVWAVYSVTHTGWGISLVFLLFIAATQLYSAWQITSLCLDRIQKNKL